MKYFRISLISLIVVVLLASFCEAQTYRGAVAGSVADSSGAAVADAVVKIVNKGTGYTRTQNTPTAGDFNFPDLAPGVYTITVSKQGFQTLNQEVEAAVGKITSVPITLGVASQTQTIEVQAAAAALETNEAVLNAVVDTRAVNDVPLNGRDFTQLLKMTPGYNDQGSMNGNRSNQNNWQIDGTDNNDFWHNSDAVNQGSISGVAGVLLPIDAIDQFNQQAGGNADFGRNAGSMVNVVIKSGTNALHGTAYYFNRNEALAVQDPFSPHGLKPELRNEHEGFSLGGPVWKNHTFFFLTFERQKFVQGNTLTATAPSLAWIAQAETVLAKYHVPVNPVMMNVYNSLFPSVIHDAPATVDNFFSTAPAAYKSENGIIKIDHVFNEKHSVFARVFLGTGEASAYAGGVSIYPDYYQKVPSRQPNFALSWNYVITPRVVNQVLAGVNYFFQAFDDTNHGFNMPGLGFNTNVTNPANFGAPEMDISGFNNGGVGATPRLGRIDTTGHLTDSLSYNVGSHALKFGAEIRKSRLDIFYLRDVRGAFTFDGTSGPWATDGAFTQPQKALADFISGTIGESLGNIATGDPQRVYDVNSFEGWVADSWQVTPKLNLNLGVRYTYNTPVEEATTHKGISTFLPSATDGLALVGHGGLDHLFPPDRNNFAPRIGFAYTPVRGGKTVIRGGWGIYYDLINGNLFIDNRVDSSAGRGISRNPGGSVPVYTVTNPATLVVQNGVPIFGGANPIPPFGAFAVSQQMRTPYVQNFNVNVQHQLSHWTLLQVGYVGNQARKLPVNLEINQPLPDPTGTLSRQDRRPYNSEFPNIAGITELRTAGTSHYNSMQISLRNNQWHGVTGQIQYTLSHAMDEESNVRNNGPEDSYNLARDWGNADFDVRHVVTGYLLYDLPNLVPKFPRLGKGWQMNLLLTHQSGSPFSVITATNISTSYNRRDRLDEVSNPFGGVTQPANSSGNYANGYQWFNGTAFAIPAAGTFGSTRRNQFYGPHFNATDFSIFKTTNITERIAAQFRVEIFNLFNQLNLANPDGNIDDGSSFGLISSTRATAQGNPSIGPGEPRNVQLALKIIW
jgi:hypothetical protein